MAKRQTDSGQKELFKANAGDMRGRAHRFTPAGVPGLRRKAGLVDDEYQKELKGKQGAKTYREMGNHSVIGAALWIIELLTRQTTYAIEPADGTAEALEVAEFCQSAIDDMRGGMTGFMTEFLSALQYGWAWMEKVYKIRRGPEYTAPMLRSKYTDGRIGIQRIGLIGQESLHEWVWDEHGEVVGMVQMPPPPDSGLRKIPRSKALHVRFRYRLDNPEGHSILRVPYTSWYYHKNFQFVEAVGIERDLAGYPVAEVPPEILESDDPADTAIVDDYKDLVRKIKRDEYEGVVIPAETSSDGNPTGYRLRLLNSGGRRPADVDPVLRRLDSRIAMSMLAEFLVVGLDKAGSYSLHSDKTSLFTTSLGAILDERDRQWNEEVFPELLRLNAIPPALRPTMKHGDIEKVDLAALGSFLQAAIGSGAVSLDDQLEDWTRERAGLPARDDSTSRPLPSSGAQLPMMDEL
jgi:hypothetical protein